jgi:hypothetical protein
VSLDGFVGGSGGSDGDELCADVSRLPGGGGVPPRLHPTAQDTRGEAALQLATVSEAAATLPAAVHVCEALELFDESQLRWAVEWQLSGQTGVGVNAAAARAAARAASRTTESGQSCGHAGSGTRQIKSGVTDGGAGMGAAAGVLEALPRWSTVLSCALVMLVGGVLM